MLDVIRKRRSIRSFTGDVVEEDKLREILKAAMFAPTSRGKRAWEFIVVKDAEMRKRLSEANFYCFFVANAPVAVVVCYHSGKGRRFKEDSSICAEHIHLEAVNQGLGSCYVQVADTEGPHGVTEDYVRSLLEIPPVYRIQCILPIGYPGERLAPHLDGEFDESKIHYERF
ncbi:MAG: nitroreductase family protein [Dehalococcoidia bacterium]|nr:nitroreductase family protein [Dehalococcoidia bacterium]